MQQGQIFRRGNNWLVRYWKNVGVDAEGKAIRKRVAKTFAPYNGERSHDSRLRELARRVLDPINDEQKPDDSAMSVLHFIDYKYMPWVREKKRPSTIKGYRDIFDNHLRSRVQAIRLRDFRTVDAQRILDDIESKTKLSHRSLIHVKSFLSGAMSFAKRTGLYDQANPLQGRGTVVVGGHNDNPETYAYTLEEILKMLNVLQNDTHRTLVTVAAFEGLSLSELRGLRWQDVTETEINVENTFWHEYEGTTKTQARKDAVPLLGIVSEALRQHHELNPQTKYVFESPTLSDRPRDISGTGKYIQDELSESGVEWHGWHAFRRGLASNLSELGVEDITIQAILRHANVSVTQRYYIKQRGQAEAMWKLEKVIRKQRAAARFGHQVGTKRDRRHVSS